MPGFVIGSPLSVVGEAWVGATDATSSGGTLSPPHVPSGATVPTQRIAFVFKPIAFGPSASAPAPSVRRIAKPAEWPNTPAIQTPRAIFAVKSAAFANNQSLYGASLNRKLQASNFANGPAFPGLGLRLRFSPAAYASAGQVYTAGISQSSGAIRPPHRASSSAVFAPAIILWATTSVTITLSLPGLIPRAPKPPQRRSTATWPNLPKVTAPPWRLTVVTPDVARERARQRLASIKRAEQLRRKRKADERSDAILNALIDETIANTIVDVVAKAG
jgi:hypothetical protein